ncbi:MAG: CusA/CzcA family heavy metal efflux RND transporter [Planctomycetes bacterium]|nr:CusA/CzcA family heavy metal efflux RND transporter [Planctomycetota bacterium]NUQ33877.1 efflux RND transporter permease subunit [Planctomycetaceae bacterium]
MIKTIIDWCGRHRGMVIAVTLLAALAGLWSIKNTALDAVPDLSDTQVIVFTEWMGRSPTLVEDQITYPIVTGFLGAPKVKAVRGFTMFGMSFVYVIFEDGTDIYWARSRTLEYLSKLQGKLPPDVTPQIGPDATGVGWVFEYALVDRSGKHDLAELRSFQDWHLRYALTSVPGVAEVASVGGYEKQYQVTVDPARLLAYNISVRDIIAAIQMSNADVGGRTIEFAEHEYAVRGRGYIQNAADIEKVVVGTDSLGTPVRISDIGRVQVGGNIRRGFAELNGEGETAGGIVVMRFGENALDVIDRVKERIEEIRPTFPEGVELVTTYDRSTLIRDSVATLRDALIQVGIVVSLMIVVFLLHFRSSLVAVLMLPVAVVLAFVPMYFMGLTSNIMSLAGIIIAIGDMVDAAVVLVENAHKKLERAGPQAKRIEIILDAAKEVGPAIFGSLLIIAISFLPVFALEAQEGRLFKPLAFTKTFSMAFAAVLSVTLVPALMILLIRGKIMPEQKNPINRFFIRIYQPALAFVLHWRLAFLGVVVIAVGITAPIFISLGSEFMPPLDEGSFLYMPVSVPGISIEEAKRVVAIQDRVLKSFPEVQSVFGKAGRAETPTDPAPLSMIETVVQLKPRSEWREGMTPERLREEMAKAVETPGFQGAWTMPVKARVDMLTTGIRTPVGIKVFGPDLEKIANIGEHLESVLRNVPGTRSVYAERELGGFYYDFIPDRAEIARYGLTVMDVLDVVETAIGGMDIARTIEGRERYTINVRYPRDLRDDPDALGRVLVPVMSGSAGDDMNASSNGAERGGHVPLAQLGRFEAVMGPPMIKDEGGSLTGWVYVDVEGRDIGGYVDDAKKAVAEHFDLPAGYRLLWTGQYEFLERIRERLAYVIPLTLLIILAILYVNFKGMVQALLVMTSVPFALVGSIWLMAAFGYNTSIAVYVGMIALVGVAAETASVMVMYLDQGFHAWRDAGKLRTPGELLPMAVESASLRVRPIVMTVGMNIIGLIPVMISDGTGADIAKRIAAPMWGGLVSLTILTLFIIPVLYVIWRRWQSRHLWRAGATAPESIPTPHE